MEKLAPKDVIVLKPTEYFNALIEGAIGSLGIRVSEPTRVYLVHLLEHFISSDNLFPRTPAGKREDQELALQLAAALESESLEEKRSRLRRLGDFSLYIAGYFSRSLEKKIVHVDYYIGMGGSAYLEAASIPGKTAPAEVFSELGHKFPAMVDLLGQVSEESILSSAGSGDNPASLLRVYDLWAKTGSERLAQQLARAGIVADDLSKKTKQ